MLHISYFPNVQIEKTSIESNMYNVIFILNNNEMCGNKLPQIWKTEMCKTKNMIEINYCIFGRDKCIFYIYFS